MIAFTLLLAWSASAHAAPPPCDADNGTDPVAFVWKGADKKAACPTSKKAFPFATTSKTGSYQVGSCKLGMESVFGAGRGVRRCLAQDDAG